MAAGSAVCMRSLASYIRGDRKRCARALFLSTIAPVIPFGVVPPFGNSPRAAKVYLVAAHAYRVAPSFREAVCRFAYYSAYIT